MATIGNTVATHADVAKRLDPSGKIAKIFEVLNRYNPVVKDMLVLECNDGTGHKTRRDFGRRVTPGLGLGAAGACRFFTLALAGFSASKF